MTNGYKNSRYYLGEVNGEALALESVTPDCAQFLASKLSHILPWSEIALGEESLFDHFTRLDPALNRFSIHYGEELVGAISVRDPWLKGPYLELLGLLPSVQRLGLGRELMTWFDLQAPDTTRSLWLLCSDFNLAAYEFYLAMGYQKTCTIDSLYAENFNDFLMRKKVK